MRLLVRVSVLCALLTACAGRGGAAGGLLEQLVHTAQQVSGERQTPCTRQLAGVGDGVHTRQTWALTMLDASGTPGSGFLWGNNYWLGSLSECRSLRERVLLGVVTATLDNNTTDWPEFDVEFYMAVFRHNGTRQARVGLPNENLISVGLCLPASCHAEQLARWLDSLVAMQALPVQQLFNIAMQVEYVRSLKEDNSWLTQPKFIIVTMVVLCLLSLLVAGTTYDVLSWQPRLRSVRRQHLANNNTPSLSGHSRADIIKMPASHLNNSPLPPQSCWARVLLCFSAYSNTELLLDLSLGSGSVGAIHGVRFLGMVWVLMVHTLYYMADYADNKPFAFRLGEGFMAQIVSNANLSTDTFFLLSGFLVAYLYLKAKRDQKSKKHVTVRQQVKEFGLMLAKRFLRLTPPYMAVLGVVSVTMGWRSATSVFHMTERADLTCDRYWWRNLLYINNLFPRDHMCMSWSWYLSNDMQFFVLGSFLLVLSANRMALSAGILGCLLLCSTVMTGLLAYSYSYMPTLSQQFAQLEVFYDPPWVRVGPYLVGMATGYFVVRLDGKLILSRASLAALWTGGAACNLYALFGLYRSSSLSPLAAALYVGAGRTLWGVGIAWIIVACCTHNAGFINRILCFPAWIPLSRLTYCAYLINPLLMSSVYLSSEASLHVGFLTIATLFLGFVLMTYLCAYVVSLAVETPTILLMKLTMRQTNTS